MIVKPQIKQRSMEAFMEEKKHVIKMKTKLK